MPKVRDIDRRAFTVRPENAKHTFMTSFFPLSRGDTTTTRNMVYLLAVLHREVLESRAPAAACVLYYVWCTYRCAQQV